MYEYKFIRVKINVWTGNPKEDYHEIIREEVENGWRLVQIFAPYSASNIGPRFYEIILERYVEELVD